MLRRLKLRLKINLKHYSEESSSDHDTQSTEPRQPGLIYFSVTVYFQYYLCQVHVYGILVGPSYSLQSVSLNIASTPVAPSTVVARSLTTLHFTSPWLLSNCQVVSMKWFLDSDTLTVFLWAGPCQYVRSIYCPISFVMISHILL